MANRMTYAEAINLAIEGNLNEETVERLEALKAQLAKRNSSGALKKPTKTQRENEDLKVKILDMLAEETDGMTAKRSALLSLSLVRRRPPSSLRWSRRKLWSRLRKARSRGSSSLDPDSHRGRYEDLPPFCCSARSWRTAPKF